MSTIDNRVRPLPVSDAGFAGADEVLIVVRRGRDVDVYKLAAETAQLGIETKKRTRVLGRVKETNAPLSQVVTEHRLTLTGKVFACLRRPLFESVIAAMALLEKD